MASTSSTSQPIALPIVHANPNSAGSYVDYQMADGSYTGSSGPFNPASYTRHFLGSPISWRASSFNAASLSHRVPEHSFLGSIDANEMRYGRTSSSSLENRDSLLNALNLFDREGELCRNYTCCGLHLNDLHALLEHFEAVHITIVNGDVQNPQVQIPFNPIANPVSVPAPSEIPAAAFDPDDMELELDLDNTSASLAPPVTASHSSPSSGAPSPPDTPISTPLSAWPSPHAFRSHHITPASSQPPSPRSKTAAPTRTSSPISASSLRPNLSLNLGSVSAFSRAHASSPHVLTKPEDAFNSYARFSQDYSSGLPGAQFNAAPADEASMVINPPHNTLWQQNGSQQQPGCVPPALLFSSSTTVTPASTPGGSRVPSPNGYAHAIAQAHAQQQQSLQPQSSASMPTTPISSTSRPSGLSRTSSTASPSLLLSKPFKCPKPNCNKSYKQANGLKYHMTHGSCNFAPPKDLEHVKDLLERKKRERERERERDYSLGRNPSALNTPTTSGPATPTTELAAEYGITEMDLREVEREAERRLRPFACGVGDCQRRYKNMNGLRYHYQHSGEHGAQGLALLASGQHECLQGAKRGHHSNHNHGGQQQQNQQPQSQYATVDDRDGKKRLVIRPMVHQPQAQAQQVQVQEQRSGINAGVGASIMVPVTVCDQQPQQTSTAQANTTQIHVTPVVVSPSASQQGQAQQQQSAAVYAGQYSPSPQQQNPYAYACYTPSTSTVSQTSTSPARSTSSRGSPTPASQATAPVTSSTNATAYQQQPGYFNNTSGGAYLGMSGMNLGLGLNHSNVSSLMGMQSGGYLQSTQAQLAAFQHQLKEQYREYAAQVQQQQSQEAKESAAV